ncbi:RsmD family RNA methyltransferase [bacterium]|nr:RsmD family RNA methyltransferase [bacterium]
MRITSGELKGREIRLARGSRARPATGFVRELVMNLFTPDRLRRGAFLDICAGSGIVGFEALSRGAQMLLSVEVDRRTGDDIRNMAREFGVEDRFRLLRVDGRRCMPAVSKQLSGGVKLSCCFLDPPYIRDMASSLLPGLLAAKDVWDDDALIIMRTPDELNESQSGLEFLGRRRAGNAWLWIFRPPQPANPGE